MSDSTRSESLSVVRRAREDDVDRILDLLTEYALPRAYFEPLYRQDPTFRPDQSWIVEQDGMLAAHVRLFDRSIRMQETTLRIAGVGNVITARACRGRGHAGRLLQAMTSAASAENFPYSILWTHIPALYERYGWVLIEEQVMRALMPESPPTSHPIREFRDEDLPEVSRLYNTENASRTGPTIRTPDYWRFQLSSVTHDSGEFLVATQADGSIVGYIRSRVTHAEVVISELVVGPDDGDVGRALVARAAQRRERHVRLRLPRSLYDLIPERERDIEDDSRFMGRILSLDALIRTLAPVLLRRLEAAGHASGSLPLHTQRGGSFDLRWADGHMALAEHRVDDIRSPLTESELAHLLFHGFDALAAELLDDRLDQRLLASLFPAQDFVIWPVDAF
ncbi:MAG: hypothetical protein NVSMB2_16620 [Chloroflexota bacterium]